MKMVITDEGKVSLLFWAMCSPPGYVFPDFVVHLFVTDVVVSDDTVIGDLTIASFTGYEQVDLTREDLHSATILDHVAITGNLVSVAYECTGGAPQTAYGWIMIETIFNSTVAGQNFDEPRVMSAGATLSLDPFDFRLKTLV